MASMIIAVFLFAIHSVVCHDISNSTSDDHEDTEFPSVLPSTSFAEEKGHIQHHMEDLVGDRDLNEMAEGELRFLYFKMHDNDNNNKLDGCELVKSLLHWHAEEHRSMEGHSHGTTRIFSNDQLAMMIDPILSLDDLDTDGFIDYSEFVSAYKSRGF